MNPFVIDKKARAVILSYKAEKKLIDYIEDLGIKIIFSTRANVDPRIDDHPDIQLHPITHKKFIVAPELFAYYKKELSPYGIELLSGSSYLGKTYPDDCPYNISRLGRYYITKEGACDKTLEAELKKLGLEPIFQKQAYAKCSSINFQDFVITCDKSILNALKNKNIETHYISNEKIILEGFNIGFLGGSCGIIDNKKILFSGDVSLLKDFNILKKILQEKEIEILYPRDLKLTDIGSIIPIV